MRLDSYPLNTLSSVLLEGQSAPPQTLVGYMLFPDDVEMRMAYDYHWRNEKFKEICARLPDPLRILNPPPRGAMGTVAYRRGWGDEPEPITESELATEDLRRFAQSDVPWKMLANLPPADMDAKISHGVISGMLAGFYLASYLALDTYDFLTQAKRRAQPSKNVVTFICEIHNLGREKYGRGRPSSDSVRLYPAVTDSLVAENWQRYRTVSHLWAAFLLLTDFRFNLDVATSSGDKGIMDVVLRPQMIDAAQDFEWFVLAFFDGQQHGRVPREAITPLHVAHPDSAALAERGLPQLPKLVTDRLRQLAAQYGSD